MQGNAVQNVAYTRRLVPLVAASDGAGEGAGELLRANSGEQGN